ncbi:unnamed protein product [Lactuca virosa]|uniref:Uncharacterized protein n=1 Tax=Lactuca virosa TaxID=75947 RepID=A0AAU9MHL3_9ASTR|nr:unnamed protein product [Lactuca virosa]
MDFLEGFTYEHVNFIFSGTTYLQEITNSTINTYAHKEVQNQTTVRSSVLDVLLEITKLGDLYLMETVLDDESEKKVIIALKNVGIFTSGDFYILV